MKNKDLRILSPISSVLVFWIITITISAQSLNNTYRLYYLGGQSNMEGFGYNDDLPADLNKEFENVLIFQGTPVPDMSTEGGKGIWNKLTPGHGTGFSSDGNTNNLSNRFGIELSFAQKILELYPGENIALIKYSKGGSSLEEGASNWGTWSPDFSDSNGINQYDNFLRTVKTALNYCDINSDGIQDTLIPCGIVWMQGESDAYHSEATAKKYEKNLKRMIDLFRAAFRVDDLPVVIGRISDSGKDDDGKLMDYLDIVVEAQASFVEKDGNAAFVTSPENYDFLEDGWHYTSKDYIDLGVQFASALFNLN